MLPFCVCLEYYYYELNTCLFHESTVCLKKNNDALKSIFARLLTIYSLLNVAAVFMTAFVSLPRRNSRPDAHVIRHGPNEIPR